LPIHFYYNITINCLSTFLKNISDIKKSVKEDIDEEVADDQIGQVLKKKCVLQFLYHLYLRRIQIVVNKSKEKDKEVYKLVEYI
jgi:hypothetical protein